MTYEDMGAEVGRLVDEKQKAYGNSFGKSGRILRELYPNGITEDQYDNMLAVIRIIDKLFRIANKKDAFGEDPFKDIAGYGLLGCGKKDAEMEGMVICPSCLGICMNPKSLSLQSCGECNGAGKIPKP